MPGENLALGAYDLQLLRLVFRDQRVQLCLRVGDPVERGEDQRDAHLRLEVIRPLLDRTVVVQREVEVFARLGDLREVEVSSGRLSIAFSSQFNAARDLSNFCSNAMYAIAIFVSASPASIIRLIAASLRAMSSARIASSA